VACGESVSRKTSEETHLVPEGREDSIPEKLRMIEQGPDTRLKSSRVLVERKKEVSGESDGLGLESFGEAV
jgi:hypothetical protein